MMEFFKKIKPLYYLYHYIKKYFVWVYARLCIILFNPKDKKEMKRFYNLYEGKRCFIIATGPSLSFEDLEMIKGEYTFSMNSIVNIYDKTDFRPTFYIIQDGCVEKRLRKQIVFTNDSIMFLGVGNARGFKANISPRIAKKNYLKAFTYNLDSAYLRYGMYYKSADKINIEFSEECSKCVKDGTTVTYSAIQLAIYMGFKEIYLLGCDTNYSGHIDEAIQQKVPNVTEPAYTMIQAYKSAKKYSEKKGIKIVNVTRGGMLEVFERKTLEDVLAE